LILIAPNSTCVAAAEQRREEEAGAIKVEEEVEVTWA
jgi:hypothetical protein